MRRGFVFNAARVAAVASLGPVAYALPQPGVERGLRPSEIEVREFLNDLWNQAWDADFIVGQSGMTLTASAQPGSWTVTVYQDSRQIATGAYDEVVRLLTPDAGAWTDGLDGSPVIAELYTSAGLLHGLDGYLTPAYGIVRRIVVNPDDGTKPFAVEVFTPLGVADSLEFAILDALDLFNTLSQLAMLAGDEPPYTTDPCRCEQMYNNDLGACAASSLSCELKCEAIAIAGILACSGTGPFAPACMALVIAADVACLGACVADFHACELRAENAHIRCLQKCPEASPAP